VSSGHHRLASAHRHVILLPDDRRDGTGILTRVLGASDAGRGGVQDLRRQLRLPEEREAHVLEHIGVAVATLTDDEIAKLHREPGVYVLDNAARAGPRPIPTPTAGIGGFDLERERLAAYLRGVIDTSQNVLRFIETRSRSERTGPGAGVTPVIRALSAGSNLDWNLQSIGVGPATLTGRGVKVAVLDTGVDLAHPDLTSHFGEPAACTANFIQAGQPVDDAAGHGTHCAGIVAGAANPQSGLRYSVAPDATLLVAKVLFDDQTSQPSIVLEGLNWAAHMGADVISLSLGVPRPAGSPASPLYSTIGSRLLASGVLLVAAAGNESNRPVHVGTIDDPAASASFMAIAAVDRQSSPGWFSSGASNADGVGSIALAAPGVDVRSAWAREGYFADSGTSVAAPHVAGAAALWMQKTGKRGSELRALLTAAAMSIGASADDVGHGLVQVPKP
jgi:subtilisin